jgi:hypothetical protein
MLTRIIQVNVLKLLLAQQASPMSDQRDRLQVDSRLQMSVVQASLQQACMQRSSSWVDHRPHRAVTAATSGGVRTRYSVSRTCMHDRKRLLRCCTAHARPTGWQ